MSLLVKKTKESHLFLCVVVVSFIIFAYTLLLSYIQTSFEEKITQVAGIYLKGIVSLNKTEQEKIIQHTYLLLKALAQEDKKVFSSPRRCQETVQKYLRLFPDLNTIGVVSKEKKIICDALPFKKGTDASDRPYIQKAIEQKKPTISDYQVGKVTKKPSINLGYPVLNQQGEVEYVLIASLKLDWPTPFIKKLELPTGSRILALDHKGKILYDYFGEKQTGQFGLEVPLLNAILTSHNSTAIIKDKQGKEMVFAFTPLIENQLPHTIIAMGIPKEAIIKKYKLPWKEIWLIHGGITLFLLSILLCLNYRSHLKEKQPSKSFRLPFVKNIYAKILKKT